MVGPLTREAILKLTKQARPVKAVEVPEAYGGGTAYVGLMTGVERDEWSASNFVKDEESGEYERDRSNSGGRLLACTLCDEQGKRLFTLADAGQVGQLPGPLVALLGAEALRFNRLTGDDVEDAEKNSEPTQPSASS